MKRFVTSDSHGGYKALVQCLERCSFDKDNDQLIFLGDVVDGWSETKESIDLLLTLKHLVYLLGNHDQWALEFYSGKMAGNDRVQQAWLRQGGTATVASYGHGTGMPPKHLRLLQRAKLYHVTEDNILCVHAGFDIEQAIEMSTVYTLLWSRGFVEERFTRFSQQQDATVTTYKEVYIGHTPTFLLNRKQTTPLQMGNVWLLDTGAGFTGCLSIMDIDTKQVWQSDKVMTLYPDEAGRNGISWNEMNLFKMD
ncbi:metallophosphoesterase [Pontibacter roseus]|uniref:metallophosphoesterase n=1 Tax=Pontibacter roseus TaxID=336989 RepID=UPI000382B707|nr:metallophosphoesterase [Pontibacter roseus]